MQREPNPVPRWIVMSAGTGGTSATIGRYIRYQGLNTKLCVADPQHSVFFDYFQSGDTTLTLDKSTNIEGIGRPRVEPSFVRTVVDDMAKVSDQKAIATMKFVNRILNREVGGSTGTNLYAAFQVIASMLVKGETGSVVSMICDSGNRYQNSYYNEQWLANNNLHDPDNAIENKLENFYLTGNWSA